LTVSAERDLNYVLRVCAFHDPVAAFWECNDTTVINSVITVRKFYSSHVHCLDR